MQIPRVDLYTTVHKGLRARLFDTAVELARCDFAARADADIAFDAYRRTAGFLREHHEHEDAHVESLLPEDVRSAVAKQHAAAESALAELDALATAADGPGLLARYTRFLVEYLDHMQVEETVVMPALWARYTDAELGAVRGRIQGAIPPARFTEWMELMLPAMNLDERAGMLGGMRANAPPPVFEAASAVAARVLGTARWNALRARLS
jgi:hypothetical protein